MAQNFAEKIMQFKLIDVDGVLLDNAGDVLLSREPEGFKDVDISLERDLETHGVFYEFASEDSEFGFDRACKIEGESYDPYEFLLAVYGRSGIDSNIEFVVTTKDNDLATEVIQYTGSLTFSTFRLVDYKISLNSKRVTLSDKFRTRIDTKVNFDDTESIDGTPVTGTFPRDTFLHGKLLEKESSGEYNEELNILDTSTAVGSNDLYQNLTFSKEILNAIEGYFVYTPFLSTLPPEDSQTYILGGDDLQQGKYTIDVDFDFRIFFDGTDTPFLDFTSTVIDVRVFYKVLDRGLNVLVDDEVFQEFAGWNASLPTNEMRYPDTPPFTDDNYRNISFSKTVNLNKGDSVYMYIKFNDTEPLTHVDRIYFGDGGINIVAHLVESGSLAKTYSPFNSVNHVLEVITDQIDPLESDFIFNELDQIQLTNGYKIRAFEDRNIITDFDSLFKGWLKPMFGLGYTIYNPFLEPSGIFKIKIEPYNYFYQDREVFNIGTIVNDTFEISIDQDLICNEIEVGYKDYPKSTDENKGNNIDEFNTIHSLLTPITTFKSKKQYISDVIASGYKIENQRREQFKDVPSDTVSDDDNLFCINSIRTDDYYLSVTFPDQNIILDPTLNTISLLGTYFDFKSSDSVNVLSDSGIFPGDGDYDVESVEILGDRFILNCTSVLISTSTNGGLTLTRDTLRRRALRNEEFDTLTGVISPDTVYNVGLNPKLMMLNHGSVFNSGFATKLDTDLISTREVKLNSEMTYEYSVGEGDYNKDTSQSRTMGDNVELQNIDNFNKLFDGLTYSFQSDLSYSDVMIIRSYYLNELDNTDNMGYISFTDPFGQERQGYLLSMNYNPFRENVEFVLRGKFQPSGGSFDYVLDQDMN